MAEILLMNVTKTNEHLNAAIFVHALVLWLTALESLRIVDAYIFTLCAQSCNTSVILHCNMLWYSVIYYISDIIDMWKSLQYQLLCTPVLRYWLHS